MSSLIEAVLNDQLKARVDSGDYKEDGLLFCGKCNTPKEQRIHLCFGNHKLDKVVPVMCRCEQIEFEETERKNKELDLKYWKEKMLLNGIGSHKYRNYTFANDDEANPDITVMCKKYVSRWEKARDEKIGLLFYGAVGTGKTFYAVSIANALIDKNVSAKVTSITEIISQMQTMDDGARRRTLENLNKVSLLVLDDIGSERDTSYGLEQAFMIIDGRYNSGLPLIATTNCTLEELQNPSNIAYKRIYDRVLEMCSAHIEVTGSSRRQEIAKNKRISAVEVLELLK